ncbi:MAG: hypothetical protein LC127_16425 [Chitinophagales bacterium]|nr:hypothetical protein [Chitinophagales bacterium]
MILISMGEGFRYNGGSQVMQSSFTNCFIEIWVWFILPFDWAFRILYCGFGSGTMANGSGNISSSEPYAVDEIGTVTYTANTTPYNDYINGDFSITSAQSINAGVGTFLMTKSGYGGTVGYPDIGAGHHLESGGSSFTGFLQV